MVIRHGAEPILLRWRTARSHRIGQRSLPSHHVVASTELVRDSGTLDTATDSPRLLACEVVEVVQRSPVCSHTAAIQAFNVV